MKNLIRNCVVASAMFVAGTVGADVIADLNPYIGAEYQHAWMSGKGESKAELPKNYPGATVYVGTKFNENFGIELGGTFKQNKTIFTDVDEIQNKAKFTHLHADLIGFVPMADNVELFASAGVSQVKFKLISKNLTDGVIDISSPKKKVVARLGLGANYMVTDMFGVRAKLGYENTAKAKRHVFKDSVTASAGAFIRF